MFRNITITTDISYCYQTKRAAYAFWISTENGPIKKSGMLKGDLNGSTTAEVLCIANAVHFLVKNSFRCRRLIVNTDSMHGATLIRTFRKHRNKHIEKAIELINATLFGRFDEVIYRHVKAHNGTNDKRSYVNDWCDREAKRVMREFKLSIKLLNKK